MTLENRLSERLAVVATIDPDAYGTGTQDTDVIDMLEHRRILFIVMAGTIASTGKIDFAVYGDTASDGAFSTLITGKSITQLTQAGSDSDKQAVVEVSSEEVQAQGKRYLKGVLTFTTAGGDAGVIAVAGDSRYQPNNVFDLASVDEIVA